MRQLKNGKAICIALPIRVNEHGQTNRMSEGIKEFVENLGFKTIESHMVYVHRTLTREIMVYEKLNFSKFSSAYLWWYFFWTMNVHYSVFTLFK